MRTSPLDTIVAPITGPHPAPVAVVRLSGPEAWRVASRVFTPWPQSVTPRLTTYGRYFFGDDGLATPFDDHSFTGEESVELSLHGATVSVRQLLNGCIEHGARLAEPGEFSLRAFLNGRIDLTQAEAIADTVAAVTERQLMHANLARSGVLRSKVSEMRSQVIAVVANLEAHIDFSEEIGDLDRASVSLQIDEIRRKVDDFLSNFGDGEKLRRGIRVAILGAPNVGKSSLLNAMIGSDRAIVSKQPGTTRDYLEELVEIDGWPVIFIDTAGLRDSSDEIEQEGIARSETVAEVADLVLYVFDAVEGMANVDNRRVSKFPDVLIVANKTDLAPGPDGVLGVSALTGKGLGELKRTIVSRCIEAPAQTAYVNRRQRDLLSEASANLHGAQAITTQDLPLDLAIVHLTQAIDSLGSVTGETASTEMLEEIFSRFCIGK